MLCSSGLCLPPLAAESPGSTLHRSGAHHAAQSRLARRARRTNAHPAGCHDSHGNNHPASCHDNNHRPSCHDNELFDHEGPAPCSPARPRPGRKSSSRSMGARSPCASWSSTRCGTSPPEMSGYASSWSATSPATRRMTVCLDGSSESHRARGRAHRPAGPDRLWSHGALVRPVGPADPCR
jgi:hypothetical protein